MRSSVLRAVAGAFLSAAALAGCQTEPRTLPVMSMSDFYKLPADQRPVAFKDPDPNLFYPYNVHRTDGLSRNPDDCVRWGCIDQNAR